MMMTAALVTAAAALLAAAAAARAAECLPPRIDGEYEIVSSRPAACSADGEVTGARLFGGDARGREGFTPLVQFGPQEPDLHMSFRTTESAHERFVLEAAVLGCYNDGRMGCLDRYAALPHSLTYSPTRSPTHFLPHSLTRCFDSFTSSFVERPCVWVRYGACDWELVCSDTDDVRCVHSLTHTR